MTPAQIEWLRATTLLDSAQTAWMQTTTHLDTWQTGMLVCLAWWLVTLSRRGRHV